MINPHRGDVGLTLDGEERTMRLTLGALASLEAELNAQSLVDLIAHFESGEFSSQELMMLLWAGLNGGGMKISLAEIGIAHIDGGPIVAAKAAARLLHATFAQENA
jgi:hypothetical protein